MTTRSHTQARRRTHRHRPEIVVFIVESEASCPSCHRTVQPTDGFTVVDTGFRCMECSELVGLEFLPSGNPSVTRLVTRFAERLIRVYRRPVEAPRRQPIRIGILAAPDEIQRARDRSAINAARKARTLNVPQLQRRSRNATTQQPN